MAGRVHVILLEVCISSLQVLGLMLLQLGLHSRFLLVRVTTSLARQDTLLEVVVGPLCSFLGVVRNFASVQSSSSRSSL